VTWLLGVSQGRSCDADDAVLAKGQEVIFQLPRLTRSLECFHNKEKKKFKT
jgi:hypothetical protein